MKKMLLLSVLSSYFLFTVDAMAQDMPPGIIVRTMNCQLNPGVTMDQAVEWARKSPRDQRSGNAVFYRQALHHNADFRGNYDFQIAWYHGPAANYVAALEGSRGGTPIFQQQVRPQDMVTCDPGTDRLVRSRTIPELDSFDGPDTLMLTRLCFLNEDASYEDAWQWMLGITENYRRAGETSLVQMNQRYAGPVPGLDLDRRGFIIQEVGATAEALGRRMDIALGMNIAEGLESPVRRCNYPAMWRSHAVYRAPPQGSQ